MVPRFRRWTLGAVSSLSDLEDESGTDTCQETDTKPITMRFGKALVSDFEGLNLFMQEVSLLRTVLEGEYQYNVICKCPADWLEDYRPMFSKVIEPVRNGRAKSLR